MTERRNTSRFKDGRHLHVNKNKNKPLCGQTMRDARNNRNKKRFSY